MFKCIGVLANLLIWFITWYKQMKTIQNDWNEKQDIYLRQMNFIWMPVKWDNQMLQNTCWNICVIFNISHMPTHFDASAEGNFWENIQWRMISNYMHFLLLSQCLNSHTFSYIYREFPYFLLDIFFKIVCCRFSVCG